MRPRLAPLVPLAFVVFAMVGVAACSGDSSPSATPRERSSEVRSSATSSERDDELTRDDVECGGQDALGGGSGLDFFDAAYVVDGKLGAICFGADDATLDRAWRALVQITPPQQLRDLALFAGFTSSEGGDDETLAFVNSLDDEGTAFQMSVNLDAFDDDKEQARLTMAHEFSHVFTQTPDQLDRSVTAAECDTYWNGEGCYTADALMLGWIDQFWTDSELAGVDPEADVATADGEPRCQQDPGFLGPYAATNPEEDFAESFAAFVFRVPAPTPEVQAKLDWMADKPELEAFRRRAEAAHLGPYQGTFETCGT